MKTRYQYRIYPKPQQAQALSKLFGCCRVVWNDALAWVMQTPEDVQWPSNAELQKLCITLAKQYPQRSWLAEVSNIPLQQSIADLGVAFKNFFKSRSGVRKGPKIGFPKFKKRSNQQSARFRAGGFSVKGSKLFLAKLGNFKVKWSRSLPAEPSSVTVMRSAAGQYHASFVVDVEQKSVEPVRASIGLDLGIKTFAFPSVGEPVLSPGYQQLTRKVKRFQRRLSRQVRGSARYNRTRLRIAKLKLKIANLRKDFLHKQSTQFVRQNQTVSLENLNVKGMLKNRRLARAISEQGWGQFRAMCEAKAKQYKDRCVSIISRWEPTSQTCSDCGFRWGKLDLSVRSVLCVSCGAEHDRDQNAARNIESSGLGLAHDVKRTVNGHQTALCGNPMALSSQPYEDEQLCLSL